MGPELRQLYSSLGLLVLRSSSTFSLALFFGSVRILLQSISTTLLLYILVIRYGGLELEIFEAEYMLEYRVPGRLFVYFVRFTAPVASGVLSRGVNYMLSLFSASEQDYASLCGQ